MWQQPQQQHVTNAHALQAVALAAVQWLNLGELCRHSPHCSLDSGAAGPSVQLRIILVFVLSEQHTDQMAMVAQRMRPD